MADKLYSYVNGDNGTCIQNDECYLVAGTNSDKCKGICDMNNKNQGCVAPKKLEGVYKFPDYVKSRGKGCDGVNIPSCYAQSFWLNASCLSTYTHPLKMDIPNSTPIQFKWNPDDAHVCNAQRWNTRQVNNKDIGYVDLFTYGDMNNIDYLPLDQGGYDNKANWGNFETHGCRAYGPAGNLPSPHCDGNDEWYTSYYDACNWFSGAINEL